MRAFLLKNSLAIIVFSLFLMTIFQCFGCNNENIVAAENDDEITVVMKNSETYQYPTVSGDEEGAIIKTQAKHYSVSEIIRNSETNYRAVYTYKPEAEYTGSDYVMIETQQGSDGASPSTIIKTIKINFIIN